MTVVEFEVRARDLYERLITHQEQMSELWVWCDTPRLRDQDAVGWKLITGVAWTEHVPAPPTLDSDGSRIFTFPGGSMGLGPDERVDCVWEGEGG